MGVAGAFVRFAGRGLSGGVGRLPAAGRARPRARLRGRARSRALPSRAAPLGVRHRGCRSLPAGGRGRRADDGAGRAGRREAAGARGGARPGRPGRQAPSPAMKPIPLLLAMTALTLIPFALLMTTCFVRISVVLSILRSAIGAPQVPPTTVLTGLALVLTMAVMAPTGQRLFQAV